MIRKLTPEDKEIFIGFANDFYHSSAVLEPIPKEYIENAFTEMMRSADYIEGFLFEAEGSPAGYAIINKTFSMEAGGTVIWIEDIMVLPKYRSLGLGSSFFAYLEEHYPADRYRLEVEAENKKAARLYKKKGYRFLDYQSMIKDIDETE